MKKFFDEFKVFITRGNVVDMSVGVIVGGAFTAIVNGLSNFILKPLINALLALIFGANSLSDLYTMLVPVETVDDIGNTVIDLANSIYIDWGSFINAIINFFLTAIVLFTIVKIFNRVRARNLSIIAEINNAKVTRAEKKAMIAEGFDPKDRESVKAYRELLKKRAEEERAKAEAEAAEKAAAERLANPTTEDLLKKIIEIIDKK